MPLENDQYMGDQIPLMDDSSFWQWNLTYGDVIYIIMITILSILMGLSYYHQQVLTSMIIKVSLEKAEAKPIQSPFPGGHEEIYVEIDSHPLTTFCVGLVVFVAGIIYIIKGLSLLYIHYSKIKSVMHRHCPACVAPKQYLFAYYLYIKISNSKKHIIFMSKIDLNSEVTGVHTYPHIQRLNVAQGIMSKLVHVS